MAALEQLGAMRSKDAIPKKGLEKNVNLSLE
jgi:hypothetical protein